MYAIRSYYVRRRCPRSGDGENPKDSQTAGIPRDRHWRSRDAGRIVRVYHHRTHSLGHVHLLHSRIAVRELQRPAGDHAFSADGPGRRIRRTLRVPQRLLDHVDDRDCAPDGVGSYNFV